MKLFQFTKNKDIDVSFNDLTYHSNVFEDIKALVKQMKEGSVNKVLIEGKAGCGKGLAIKAVTYEAGFNMIGIHYGDLLSLYCGVEAQRIHQLFKQAKKKAPCVIVLDDINCCFATESKENETIVESLINEMPEFKNIKFLEKGIDAFLDEMSKLQLKDKVVVIATTTDTKYLNDKIAECFDEKIEIKRG
jgi:AAA+ superfamily predicted ATPase